MLFQERKEVVYEPVLNKSIVEKLEKFLSKNFVSFLLTGPVASGKTTFLTYLLEKVWKKNYVKFIAGLDSVSKLKELLKRNVDVVWIEEIHRLKKNEQEILLIPLEQGNRIFVATTAESINQYLTKAIISRFYIFKFFKPTFKEFVELAKKFDLKISREKLKRIYLEFNADARVLLKIKKLRENLTDEEVEELFGLKANEEIYNITSAFIKSLRASKVDAAFYWGFRLLKEGVSIDYIFRRLVISAAEDVGLGENQILTIINNSWQAARNVGSPEDEIILAFAIAVVALAKKDNTSYQAMKKVKKILEEKSIKVPDYLKNYTGKYINPHFDKRGLKLDYMPGIDDFFDK